ncbi:MAG: alginate export family protein [Burkholderiaceae bacterium]
MTDRARIRSRDALAEGRHGWLDPAMRRVGRVAVAATIAALSLLPVPAPAMEDFDLAESNDWEDRDFERQFQPLWPAPWGAQWHLGRTAELEWDDRRNENLDRADDEDRSIRRAQFGLVGNVFLGRHHRLEATLELADNRRQRADRAGSHATELKIKSLFWQWRTDNPAALLVVGRQTVKDEREWLFDEELDGVGLAWRGDGFGLLGFLGRQSWFKDDLLAPRDDGGPRVGYLRLYRAFQDRRQASIYWVGVDERGFDDQEELDFFGARAMGRLPAKIDFWLEAALVRGRAQHRPISGHGFDVGVTRAFKEFSWRPSLTMALALGSGDDGSGDDHAFRQTGLQGNTARLDGVASIDYYGHALDPELSNLTILTLGAGVRPSPSWSMDLTWHRYSQQQASTRLRDSRLDSSPDGIHRSLGWGANLTLGMRYGRNMKFEAVFGYFSPGAAFDADASAIRRFELVAKFRY